MSETTLGARERIAEAPIDIGDRVILAVAKDRSRTALGTVIDRDPHPDRNVLVRVLHDDGVPRWRRRDALRALGHRMSADDLAADLKLMGLADLNDIATPGDAETATDGAHSPASGRTDVPRHTETPHEAGEAQEAAE